MSRVKILNFSTSQNIDLVQELQNDIQFIKSSELSRESNQEWIATLERRLADLMGKESAIFSNSHSVPQLAALKVHSESAGGIRHFAIHPHSQMDLQEHKIGESYRNLTLEDIKNGLDFSGPHAAKTVSTIVLEIPLLYNGGTIVAWNDLEKIRGWADRRGVKLHADGTKLLEAQAYYNRTFSEICSQFDSVFLSFHHGSEAFGGSMILGDADTIDRAREWMNRVNSATMKELLPFAVNCHRVLSQRLENIENYHVRFNQLVALLSKEFMEKGYAIRFVPEVPETLSILVVLKDHMEVLQEANQMLREKNSVSLFEDLQLFPNGLQIPRKKSLDTPKSSVSGISLGTECYFEWCLGESNHHIDDSTYLSSWKNFFEYRHQIFLQKRFNG